VHDQTYPVEGLVSNRGNGYRDLIGHIDLATYRRIPWENNIPFFLLRFTDQDTKEWIEVDPRSLLEKIVTDAKGKGWDCMSGAEFEVRFIVIIVANLIVLPVCRDCRVRGGEGLYQAQALDPWK
jgi:glutamine synthetase